MSEVHETTTSPEPTSGRREFFSKAAIAAAAAAVAGVSLSNKASAANGDTVIVGFSTTGTSNTTLSGGTSFRVLDGTSHSLLSLPVSIYGYSSGAEAGIGLGGVADGANAIGVTGVTSGTGGVGVFGRNSGSSGRGVYGFNEGTDGSGVYGESTDGPGVVGDGSTVDFSASGSGKIYMASAGVLTSTSSASAGTLARDASGNMWVAVAGNDWRKIAGPGSAGSLHLLAVPTRVYDSRAGKTPTTVGTKAPLTSGSRTINCTKNSSGVPSDAKGVLVNVTVLWSSATGYVAVTPGGAGDTGTSTANSPGAGGKTASAVTVACSTDAKIDISSGSGAAFDFIVDVNGYYI